LRKNLILASYKFNRYENLQNKKAWEEHLNLERPEK